MSRQLRERIGMQLFILGFVVSGVDYLITAGYFLSNDKANLAVILLLVPPSELVLPWVANTTLGIISAVGLVLFIAGAFLKGE